MPIHVEQLKRLGIDEISLVKGQGKFIVVLVDLDTHKLVGLVSSRTQSEIEKVMRQWGEKVLEQIEEVSSELSARLESLESFADLCQSKGVKSSREIMPGDDAEPGIYAIC
jgi:transposase